MEKYNYKDYKNLEFVIKSTLQCYLQELKEDYKNYFYKLMLALKQDTLDLK